MNEDIIIAQKYKYQQFSTTLNLGGHLYANIFSMRISITLLSKHRRVADGNVSMPYGQFPGYEKGEDGIPKIVEKEAVVVRIIYKLFLEGKTSAGIAKHLTTNKILTSVLNVKL